MLLNELKLHYEDLNMKLTTLATILILMLSILTSCLQDEKTISIRTNNENSSNTGIVQIPIYNNNLAWITQLGATTKPPGGDTSGNDICIGVAVDGVGNVYCSGYTNGSLVESNGGNNDVFVMKLNNNGELVWIKQLGSVSISSGNSSGDDYSYGIAVSDGGNVYISGTTTGNLGEANGGSNRDAFVAKLDSFGNLIWIKQLGSITSVPGGDTSNLDQCNDIALDSNENVYCAGATAGALGEGAAGFSDAFILKLNSSGTLVWLKQLGNTTSTPGGDKSEVDECKRVAVDDAGNVYCAGGTKSSLGETVGGNFDAFILKLNTSGDLVWIKQLGSLTSVPGGDTSSYEICWGLGVDSQGNVYCSGDTYGSLGEGSSGGGDIFIMKVNSSGNLVWVKQFGDTTVVPGGNSIAADNSYGLAIDSNDDIYITGGTQSALGEGNGGSSDTYVSKLDSDGNLIWLKQLGNSTVVSGGDTSGSDLCLRVAVNSSGEVFCSGRTMSSLGEANGGSTDAFVMKLE